MIFFRVNTVMGGDFNQIQDNVLDRTTYSKIISKDRQTIHLLMKDSGLLDIWGLINPREKEYTFYSHKHKSHSRLDYFLISMIESVVGCRIGIIALTAAEVDSIKRNTSLYQDPVFDRLMSQDPKSFFEINGPQRICVEGIKSFYKG